MGIDKIKELKKEKRITTERLSELSGVPIGTINKILNGSTKDPKLNTLISIASVLGCTVNDFVDDTEIGISEMQHCVSSDNEGINFQKVSDVSSRLVEIMCSRGLKQADILHLCKPYEKEYGAKITKSALSQYISGYNKPKHDKLSLLAKALSVNESWLLGFDIESDYKNDITKMVQDIYNKPALKILFDESKKLSNDDVLAIVDIVKRLNRQN